MVRKDQCRYESSLKRPGGVRRELVKAREIVRFCFVQKQSHSFMPPGMLADEKSIVKACSWRHS